MYKYRAKMIRVIDGDTIEALIDLGFEIATRKTIRLHGINAPEIRGGLKEEKEAGLRCKRRLEELLEASDGNFILTSHGVGKFGRCLGELYIKEDETSLNQQLINEGLAEEYE